MAAGLSQHARADCGGPALRAGLRAVPARRRRAAGRTARRRADARAPTRHELPAQHRFAARRRVPRRRADVPHARPLGTGVRAARRPRRHRSAWCNRCRSGEARAAWLRWLCAAAGAGMAEPLPSPLHNDDIPRILAFGPWPPPPQRDPSNRVSGQPAAIAWGATLFVDTRLSRGSALACASCHQPQRGFSDGLPVALGLERGIRNTSGLMDVGQQRWFGWDGANDNLWAQSLRPLLDAARDGRQPGQRGGGRARHADLRDGYRRVFGAAPAASDERGGGGRGQGAGRLPGDAGQRAHALRRLPRRAAARRPRGRRGLPAGGAARAGAVPGPRAVAMCATAGRPSATASSTTSACPSSSAKGRSMPAGTAASQACRPAATTCSAPTTTTPRAPRADQHAPRGAEHRHFGEFKVPSLRNLAATAPYMHNGSQRTLREVLRHYSELDENRLHADGETHPRAAAPDARRKPRTCWPSSTA